MNDLLFLGAEEHRHKAALQLGILFRGGNFSTCISEIQQQLLTQVGMRHLTTPETDADLDPVAILQEFERTFYLGIEVIGVDAGAHTDFLDFHDLLILLGFLLTLLLVEAELGIVHNLTDRGDCIGRDFHQVEALLLCHTIGFVCRHDAQLRTIGTDQSNLLIPDFLIELMI